MGFRWCERGILDYSGQFIVLIRTGWLAGFFERRGTDGNGVRNLRLVCKIRFLQF